MVAFISVEISSSCSKIPSADSTGSCSVTAAFSVPAGKAQRVNGPSQKVMGSCTADTFTGTSLPPVGSSSGNTMSVTVNGANCGASNDQYANQPCVTVTICSTATPTTCQTISNILLDTGSYGLRLFSSAITIPLTPITTAGGTKTLAECVLFGDGSSEFGPVKYAYVKLGNEPKVEVPIMVIADPSFPNTGTPCDTPLADTSPSETHFNGILGVGLLAADCGAGCASPGSGQYFTCQNGNCSCDASADLLAQVTNPISALPTDNNGLILSIPSVPEGGAASVNGTLFLGVDTQANNASSGATSGTLTADAGAQIKSKFGAFSSTKLASFIDSGSSILFIPSASSLPDCGCSGGSDYSGLFCPATIQNLSSINYNSNGSASPASTVNFSVDNAINLYNSGNNVFPTMAGSSGKDTSAYMDWGLPFFYGKNVIVGIEGTNSSLGTGPYWAY